MTPRVRRDGHLRMGRRWRGSCSEAVTMETLHYRRTADASPRIAPAPASIPLFDALPSELETTLRHDRTREAFVRLSPPQQTAYVEWVNEGANPSVRAIRAMMVSHVLGQIG